MRNLKLEINVVSFYVVRTEHLSLALEGFCNKTFHIPSSVSAALTLFIIYVMRIISFYVSYFFIIYVQ
jgi:hypothetical protein